MSKEVITFGCRLNAFESEQIKKAAASSKENLIIFNSCAVTNQAEQQLRQAIRRARKENPDKKIIVTGCAAQISPAKYAAMEQVDMVLGNVEKSQPQSYNFSQNVPQKISDKNINPDPEIIHKDKLFYQEQASNFSDLDQNEKILVNNIMSVKDTAEHFSQDFSADLDFSGKSRAFVQIQNGCNHRCTFCIIPYGRGNSRSVPFGEIATQVQKLVEKGFREVVLTGVDISDYGKDLLVGLNLGQMIKRLLKLVPDLPRLRLSSIDVAEINADLLDLIANEPRFMPYLHISLQSGDDTILKRMKRRHNRAQIVEFCQKVKELRPQVAFGSDIIAGFPTESEAMFENTLNLISEADLVFNHIFPFSPKSGTPAAKMPQLSNSLRKERAAKLRQAGSKQLEKFLMKMVGSEQRIIVENGDKEVEEKTGRKIGQKIGRCENFVQVKLQNLPEETKVGEIINIKISGWRNEFLID